MSISIGAVQSVQANFSHEMSYVASFDQETAPSIISSIISLRSKRPGSTLELIREAKRLLKKFGMRTCKRRLSREICLFASINRERFIDEPEINDEFVDEKRPRVNRNRHASCGEHDEFVKCFEADDPKNSRKGKSQNGLGQIQIDWVCFQV